MSDDSPSLLDTIRHWPDRRAHPRRHEEACRRLAALGRPRAVLLMCLGNICRSPYAAARLQALLAATPLVAVEIRSAGLIGPGRSAPSTGQAVAQARGLDLADHVSRTLEPSLVRDADLVFVMAQSQAEALRGRVRVPAERVFILGDFDPEPIATREIDDPYHGDVARYEASYARIDRCLAVVAATLTGRASLG